MNQGNQKRALGKGLEQLFGSDELDFNKFEQEIVASTPESDIKMIDVDEIRSNPYQPRIHFDEEALNELASSIKDHGVLEPIIVKKSIKGYVLIAGERRTKATRLAGLKTIPAIVKDFSDDEMMEIAILENIQRENLNPIEEALGYKNFMDKLNLTQDEVAKKFGKSRSYITNLLGLLNLPEIVKRYVAEGKVSMSHARVLSKMSNEDEILILADKIINDNISVRLLEEETKNVVKKKPIKKEVKEVNTTYQIYENKLRDTLGTKATVSKNKVVIPFDSEADLNRIMEILNIEIGE